MTNLEKPAVLESLPQASVLYMVGEVGEFGEVLACRAGGGECGQEVTSLSVGGDTDTLIVRSHWSGQDTLICSMKVS